MVCDVVGGGCSLYWGRASITQVLHSNLSLHYLCYRKMHTGKFIKTFTNTTSFESSLEAAADEMVKNEDTLKKSTIK